MFFPMCTALALPRVRPGLVWPAIEAFVRRQRLAPVEAYASEAVLALQLEEDEALRAAVLHVSTRDEALLTWLRPLGRHLAQACRAEVLLVSAGADDPPPGAPDDGHVTWVGHRAARWEGSGRERPVDPDLDAGVGFTNPVQDDCPHEEFHELFSAAWARLLPDTRRLALISGEGCDAAGAWRAPPLHADRRIDALARRALLAEHVAPAVSPDGRAGLCLRDGDARELVFPDPVTLAAVAAVAGVPNG